MNKIPLTVKGAELLRGELHQLKTVERPKVILAIQEARSHGDLSENAEYDAAKERQSFIEGRIRELEGTIAMAEVIDPAKLTGSRVVFGATVRLADTESGEETVYSIVGDHEGDIKEGRIAISAPLARALIGREPGDTVNLRTSKGSREYQIQEVRFVPLDEA